MEFLRSKQSGIQHDFTGDRLTQDLFILDEVAKCGLESTITALAYDPIQSLLAAGTSETKSQPGSVHIFGQKRVHVHFSLLRKASVKHLRLRDNKVVVCDTKNELTIFDLEAPGAAGIGYSPPGVVTTVYTDPALDWAFLGLQSGEVVVYDIDREVLSPFKIPNFWRDRSPKARLLPVVSLALHPRDVGTLLIGYNEGAVVYSLKQNKAVHYLHFEILPGAPGADTEPAMINTLRKPRLTQALWHPTGTFIMTTYEDSCMAFWDPKDGRLVQSRTLQDAGVHIPRRPHGAALDGDVSGSISIRQPLFKVAWCCTSNPDDTSILVSGGNEMSMPAKGMTLLDLGPTPNMVTSKWEVIEEHIASPRRQRILPTPTDLDVIDFCLIPRTSPHYAGAHDPSAVIALLSSGELTTLRFPDGHPLSPARLLHPSLSLSHPYATRVDIAAVKRDRWLGMTERRNKDNPAEILVGGLEYPKPMRRYENRTVMQSAHMDGTVRIWDVGHADEVENGVVLELDLGRILQRGVDLQVACVSMASAAGETAVGMETGEVVVYRWGMNKAFGKGPAEDAGSIAQEGWLDVRLRADPEVKEGLLPLGVLRQNCGAPVAMKMSDVGFLAIAYQTGHLCVVDLRGPAVIFHHSLTALTKEQKRSSFRKSIHTPSAGEKATVLEFGVLTLDQDEFSSICLFAGTTAGRILTFKLLPSTSAPGSFVCELAGSTSPSSSAEENPAGSAVVSITPLNSETGGRAWATPHAVAGLRDGVRTPGVLCACTVSEVRIFRAPASKGAHKHWGDPHNADTNSAVAAAVTELEDYGVVLTALMRSGAVRSFSLPGLKEVAEVSLSHLIPTGSDPRLHESKILGTGHIWIPMEPDAGPAARRESLQGPPASGDGIPAPDGRAFLLLYLWGKGSLLSDQPNDTLYNPATPVPPRPTISNFQWISGTVHVTTEDLNLLIGGPDRPLSRKMRAQMQADAMAAREEEREERLHAQQGGASAGGGVFAGMMKGINERTEKLNVVGDSMDRLGESSASFADDVSKFVNQQKKKALLGGLAGKFL